jgi:hypothetical protein
MLKVMILTDSNGNPRSFPESERFELEETYPYRLREYFKEAQFWQLSFGNMTTSPLVSQPMSYLTHWKPDIIIVQTGFNDCKPQAFSDFQKEMINKLSGPLFSRLKKYVEHPQWIKKRQKYRITPTQFRTVIKKFKAIFPSSRIFWVGICTGPNYEITCPGINNRVEEFNKIIEQIYGVNYIPVNKEMINADGINAVDHLHWNRRGHEVVFQILRQRIENYLSVDTTQAANREGV